MSVTIKLSRKRDKAQTSHDAKLEVEQRERASEALIEETTNRSQHLLLAENSMRADVEQRVIELLLTHKDDALELARRSDLQEDHFADKDLKQVFQTIQQRALDGKEIDLISIVLDLIEANSIDQETSSRLVDLDDMIDASTLTLQTLIEKQKTFSLKSRAKRMIRLAQIEADEDHSIESIAKTISATHDLLENANVSKSQRFERQRFDVDNEPADQQAILSLKGIPIAFAGNVSMLRGANKVGKSHIMKSMLLAAQGVEAMGFSTEQQSTGAVLYVDCEQSANDFFKLVKKAYIVSDDASKELFAYHMTGHAPKEILSLIETLLHERSDIAFVCVDGFADLVEDVNDAEESNALVRRMMQLASKFCCSIFGVLHLNPNSDTKSRGHLGSQLERKCETILQVDHVQGTDSRVIYTAQARHRPILKDDGLRFEWCNDAHDFVEATDTLADIQRADDKVEADALVVSIFASTNQHVFAAGDLIDAIMKLRNCSRRTAYKLKTQMERASRLRQNSETKNFILDVKNDD